MTSRLSREELRAHLDRGLTPKQPWIDDGREFWRVPPRVLLGVAPRPPPWRDFEPCACVPVPVRDGTFGFVVKRCNACATTVPT